MLRNTGSIDRVIRIIVGLVLIGLTLADKIGAWGWVGVLPIVTGFAGWCPAYALFGFKTCKTAKR